MSPDSNFCYFFVIASMLFIHIGWSMEQSQNSDEGALKNPVTNVIDETELSFDYVPLRLGNELHIFRVRDLVNKKGEPLESCTIDNQKYPLDNIQRERILIQHKISKHSKLHGMLNVPSQERTIEILKKYFYNKGRLAQDPMFASNRNGEDEARQIVYFLKRFVTFAETDKVCSNIKNLRDLELRRFFLGPSTIDTKEYNDRGIHIRVLGFVKNMNEKLKWEFARVIFVEGKGYYLAINELMDFDDINAWEWEKHGYPSLISLLTDLHEKKLIDLFLFVP